jgi:cellulose synthase/poly-beta-1,6-N-acetylglucosamine synthase-like glycosyltransferase
MSRVIGIMAHDEEANIVPALRSILGQAGPHVGVFEVIVVASGCTDDTVSLARRVAAEDRRVRVVEQAAREGKASAINLFLGAARDASLLVLAGADTRLEPGALDALLAPFDDPGVGMTGGRPVPVNAPDTLLGRVVRLQWDLHDAVARREPKLGELVAFRPPAAPLDPTTAVDEAFLEASFLRDGFRRVYVPEARVAMKGPTTVADFLAQRRRIHAGHLRLRDATGHAVSTLSAGRALACALRLRREGRTSWTTIAATAGLELAGRALGTWDASVARRDHHAWRPIRSTKDLTP